MHRNIPVLSLLFCLLSVAVVAAFARPLLAHGGDVSGARAEEESWFRYLRTHDDSSDIHLFDDGNKPEYNGHHKLNSKQMAEVLSNWRGECFGLVDCDLKLSTVRGNDKDSLDNSVPLRLHLVFPDDFSYELPFTADLFDPKTGEKVGRIHGTLSDGGLSDGGIRLSDIDATARIFRSSTPGRRLQITGKSVDVLVSLKKRYASIAEARQDEQATSGNDASSIDATMLPPGGR